MAVLRYIFSVLCIYLIVPWSDALAPRSQGILAPLSANGETVLDETAVSPESPSLGSSDSSTDPVNSARHTQRDLANALKVMQDKYFELWQGTWPTAIDWTAAVMGTQVSGTLSSLTSAIEYLLPSNIPVDTNIDVRYTPAVDRHGQAFENLVNHFFDQTTAFYFGEDAFAVRTQAFDDMLWVVLEWLESIKLQELHSDLHYRGPSSLGSNSKGKPHWHGFQYQIPAAHRSRLFYGLASEGWDVSLCGGGMIWSPYLTPYKNAITNELFISASIGMYLYFPGDPIDSPFMVETEDGEVWSDEYPHSDVHLQAAIDGYKWLNNSNMIGPGGLYGDGFHISGWQDTKNPGTRKCDVLNTMVYTYNQGVILSGLRGLWLATESPEYLDDGHELVRKVLRATGWPNKSSKQWKGLGRGGVLEDACDSSGNCSQDGQTFKGIFFHHLAEFCRPVRPQEWRFLVSANRVAEEGSDWDNVYQWHQARCQTYGPWVKHNAKAALVTRDPDGKFGTWWGRPYGESVNAATYDSPLPEGAVDYRNNGDDAEGSELFHGRSSGGAKDQSGGTEQTPLTESPDATGMQAKDVNDRGRGRTVETQSGGVAVLRALYQWESFPSLSGKNH
ncbi:putative glycosyl hydrolase [Aspergillus steynii IBT 23096]|uniref:Putative glycosyl hydrolase n=1 Tax=Aspergillus steynii IBT 23096 TaxID=1392250 RepID=A0A2I2FYA7_9EURO|nr:putative glycosyl hydrolase [Aspergillus steynii IBT 23096]PLB45625.1 putative glycosyl hydrolase [Aspergillus steynii IBT 23096]